MRVENLEIIQFTHISSNYTTMLSHVHYAHYVPHTPLDHLHLISSCNPLLILCSVPTYIPRHQYVVFNSCSILKEEDDLESDVNALCLSDLIISEL